MNTLSHKLHQIFVKHLIICRKSGETERRWTPIILNSANFPSGTSEGLKRENTWEYRREPQVSRPRRHQSAQAILKPK
ncbi:Hypothetical predicted protein [Paramuricea clavata]|uniref:Uncharacterized protein n=1 Tax=Paramuricea clavata TaxID=317549 RepID=A0A6S7GWU6_PARCT|nr:Hypothetical predicted protein [Paramuricea clavata]